MTKKCAVINDISGFGKCSLTAAIPIISVMGVEVHPLVTAVLSNQTAYESYSSVSLTDKLSDFIHEWKKLNVRFDSILTGFVADEKQLDIISEFIDTFKSGNTILVVDPVMADNGSLYDGYNSAMCSKMRLLCKKADVITPNICELALLADEDFSNDYNKIERYAHKLIEQGIKNIVVTGYRQNGEISNIVFSRGETYKATAVHTGGYYSGTGDIFSCIVTGALTRGMSLNDAVSKATSFIEKAVFHTSVKNHNDGVEFETILEDLIL